MVPEGRETFAAVVQRGGRTSYYDREERRCALPASLLQAKQTGVVWIIKTCTKVKHVFRLGSD